MDHQDAATLDRRTFLRTGAGATAAAAGGAATTGTAAAQETQEIVVGPEGDQFTFSPDNTTIAPGTTVNFVWETDGHNVVPENQPDDADWGGHEPVENAGFEYSHTFEALGTYDYICVPHAPGMSGSIEVAEGGGSGGEGGGNAGPPEVPAAAMSLTTGLIGAIVTVCALAFYFLKYGGTEEE